MFVIFDKGFCLAAGRSADVLPRPEIEVDPCEKGLVAVFFVCLSAVALACCGPLTFVLLLKLRLYSNR